MQAMVGVSVRVSIAVRKHHDQKQAGEERVYLAVGLRLVF